ncbi:MAG: hypothetical protein GEV11_11010 [Streptosporangiales bacterium]|nr:hypothetical protein [Streptosporangiales bacterium]
MSCEHLICARCSGPVVEGHCPACRAAREELHQSPLTNLSPVVIAAVLLLLALLFAAYLQR